MAYKSMRFHGFESNKNKLYRYFSKALYMKRKNNWIFSKEKKIKKSEK